MQDPGLRVRKELPGLKFQADSTILIEGPASFKLTEGEAFSLGAPLRTDTWTTVREDRQLTVETPDSGSLEIRLGAGGKYKIVKGSTIPTGWREASTILRQAPGTVVILGSVDSGKSTLCTFLANDSLTYGSKVSIIDGDVGQADIGPPTTISMCALKDYTVNLTDLKPDISLFMGDTSPSSVPEKLSAGLTRLGDLSREQSDIVLVNTDGWVVGDDAIRHKLQVLSSLRPSLVLGISGAGEIDPLLEKLNSTTLRLERSSYARTRSREERRRFREFGYRRFLRDAEQVELSLREVTLRRFNSYRQLKIEEEEDLRGLIAGLISDDEKLLAISRVEGLRAGTLAVTTALKAQPRIVELGSVMLSPKFEELGYDV